VVIKVTLGGTCSPTGAGAKTCWKLRDVPEAFATLHTSVVRAHEPQQTAFAAMSHHREVSITLLVAVAL
jgi:hypothetical protein